MNEEKKKESWEEKINNLFNSYCRLTSQDTGEDDFEILRVSVINKIDFLLKEQRDEKPKPKFFDGQIVTTTKEHFSQHEVVILISPHYVKDSGWWYGNLYCFYKDGKIQVGGGSSYSWAEKDFQEITDLKIKVACDAFYLNKRKGELIIELKTIEEKNIMLKYVSKYLNAPEPLKEKIK